MTQRDEMIQPGNEPQTDKLDDHHRQQLSAMLDGELLPDQAKFMLRRLEHDGDLAACWERWQVCGDILRGRHDTLLPADFSRRIADAIAGQQQHESPAQAPVAARHPRWARWGGGAALAASVAMVALFVGRQVAGPETEPVVHSQVVASAGASAAVESPVIPVRPAPSAPLPGPDTASTLATAVAVAEVPRRAVERRTARAQQQRAATRSRRVAAAQSPMRVAAASASPPTQASAPLAPAAGDVQPSAPVTALFAAEPVQPRPWPRAILPGFAADSAFSASYGRTRQEHPFHPFEPRVELEPMPAQQPPAASGPR
ncbi:RseA family anti-sigma factor [Luteimonas notoginsengisoli]|uniref:RseA family anti-sigma factor n=1 Tax=Luteimonas notoginsengisoli TaxID=1578200 RepID=A0ABV7USG2_9GAMM